MENLSLGPNRNDQQQQQQQHHHHHHQHQQQHSPPSQPPTPPSTPLSPKSNELTKYNSSNLSTIPNLTITQTSSLNLPQNLSKSGQKTPLNLGRKIKQQQQQESLLYSNGSSSTTSNGGSICGDGGLNLSINSDYPYQMDLELLRTKMVDEKVSEKNLNNSRVSFKKFLAFVYFFKG